MNVLFVCTGNTCRSPMAEGYLNSLNLEGVYAKSTGLSFAGEPASLNSVNVMKEIGIDISRHRSSCITASHIQWADSIVCMTEQHSKVLCNMGIDSKKISVLKGGIPDPFGMDITVYRKCRDCITEAVRKQFSVVIPSTAVVEDISQITDIVKIEEACFSQPWSENSLKESFLNGTQFIFVQENSKKVGYAGINIVADEGYITNIGVLPDCRNRGIATLIMSEIIRIALKKELSFVSLEVRKSNEKAIRLYDKFGFSQEGIRKKFYTHPTEDALIFTRRFKV